MSRPTILDAESVAWLETVPGNLISPAPSWPITHDRYFLDNVAGWILELDRGRGIPYEGNYTGWLEQKQKRLAAGRPRRESAPAAGACSSELDWVRESPRARPVQGQARA